MGTVNFYMTLHAIISVGIAALLIGLAIILSIPALCVLLDWLDARRKEKEGYE